VKHGEQIKEAIASAHLKGDARAFVVFHQEDAIAQDAMYEVDRGAVHHDELHGTAEALTELGLLQEGLPE